jgi:hypothetical protein
MSLVIEHPAAVEQRGGKLQRDLKLFFAAVA